MAVLIRYEYEKLARIKFAFEFLDLNRVLIAAAQAEHSISGSGAWEVDWEDTENGNPRAVVTYTVATPDHTAGGDQGGGKAE